MATATQTAHATQPCHWPTREAIEQNLREVRRVATAARHEAEDTVAEAALNIRRHPLRAVAGAAIVAGAAGIVFGFGIARFARTGRFHAT